MSQLGPFLQAVCQNRMGSLEWYSEAALQTSLSWKLEKTKQRSHTVKRDFYLCTFAREGTHPAPARC